MWNSRVEVLENYPVKQASTEFSFQAIGVDVQVDKGHFYQINGHESKKPSLSEMEEIVFDKTLQIGHFEVYDSTSIGGKNKLQGVIEISLLPGVTDNSAKALEEAFLLFNHNVTCSSGSLYFISAEKDLNLDPEQILEKVAAGLYNPLIQGAKFLNAQEFEKGDRFHGVSLPKVSISHQQSAKEVVLDLSDMELLELSRVQCLALSLEELHTIRSFYSLESTIKSRQVIGLPKWPLDVEIEVLAQTWSEHCKHKIFAAEIDYQDSEGQFTVDSLYKSYIKKATKDIEALGVDWLVSVFSDNAGIVRFDKNIDLCIKAETHNSPSALDPYGGAITGILGVNRDILGCGLGAKPIANTDVFCFASTDLPKSIDNGLLPLGLMEPKRLLEGVHKGVEDGGNKSGIPTINGAIVFDLDYAGKPLVFCGTVGVLPARLADGREGKEKGAKVGDHIFVIGGAVGADGIHGATFSSLELNEDSPATAVQIGDPLTQKRVMDFMLKARDLSLYTCVTDNGAGGISSSIGEMAEFTGGAKIDLAKHPTKYPGLSPWEIMISESQERMTFAVDPKNSEEFRNMAKIWGVTASNLGEFTDSTFLDVFYGDERVAYLPMNFLHDGNPRLKLKANWTGPKERTSWVDVKRKQELPVKRSEILNTLLHRENIASKEYWVRQYDHEVQGATVIKPFSGEEGISPGDCGAIDLEVHGGEKNSVAFVGCGIAPRWSQFEPSLMAKISVDEAFRNIVVSGANPEKICLLDNFCWPDPVKSKSNPEGEYKLGQLVKTCVGLYDITTLYRAPLVSGKDSMKNDFKGKNRNGEPLAISIQPTLLVTAMGHGHKNAMVRAPISKAEGRLFRVGEKQLSFMASELKEIFDDSVFNEGFGDDYNAWRFQKCLNTYNGYYKLVTLGLIENAHDVSDGGLAVAVSEMLFDKGLGFVFKQELSLLDLYGEGPGQIVVNILEKNIEKFLEVCGEQNIEAFEVGSLNNSGKISFDSDDEVATVDSCHAWRRSWK